MPALHWLTRDADIRAAARDDLSLANKKVLIRLVGTIKEWKNQMTTERTPLGREIETALGEVLAHVRGEIDLPCRIVDNPNPKRIRTLRDGIEDESQEIRQAVPQQSQEKAKDS